MRKSKNPKSGLSTISEGTAGDAEALEARAGRPGGAVRLLVVAPCPAQEVAAPRPRDLVHHGAANLCAGRVIF